MGCTPSKQSVCRNCNAQCSPVRRSYSSLPRRSSLRDDHTDRMVTLPSTTLGYFLLNSSTEPNQTRNDQAMTHVPDAHMHQEPVGQNVLEKDNKDFTVEVIEAKIWSKLINEKITKIVPKTPVNTPSGEPEVINAWELMEGLDDSSPFHQPSKVDHNANKSLENGKKETVSRTKEKLILYYTSLRGVRKTYEDCCHVRMILKNYRIRVDERDVSMHLGFKDELKELLGDRYVGGTLPKVFVGMKYIGGADEIMGLHDEFQLDRALEGCEMVVDSDGDGCDACGNVRFLLCEKCSGSCKIYHDVNSDNGKEEVEEESDNYGFQRCPDCNENGLIRCRICCN
ncbi:hypothetical protein E3N88_30244 [Mikania micrantha]|uniref:Glutaredoxin domain-containing protein n=1 Tax=Mikania micrantha TaxID=192012 RepID=A0A5N6ML16_9ASTR|nr:hypothetical protein E3N88_30244 [Mikania micrantha]